jgi:phytoene synthase
VFSPSAHPKADVLDIAYDHCQQVAKEHAKNFYYASRTLPLQKRRAIYAAYAVCRLWDDIADDDAPLSEKRRMFAETRRTLATTLSAPSHDESDGSNSPHSAPEFIALADATNAFGIPVRYYDEILVGVESDLVKDRFANFAELREYCYRVASVVGLICIEVFGYDDPGAEDYAVDMGIALQLTNILRDLKEDAGRDRIYIPQDEMAEFGYTEEDLKNEIVNDRFRSLMKYQVDRARSHYEKSRPLFDMVELESRTCLRVLHEAYAAILDRIEDSGFDVFSQRIGLSASEKLLITARLWIGSAALGIPVVRRLL